MYSCSSEPDYNSALLQCGVTIQSDGSRKKRKKKLHQTTLGVERFHANAFSLAKSGEGGNDALHNGSVVLLAPQRKLQLSDQTPKKRVK